MASNDEVGRRIREAREEANLSQGELARRMTKQRTHAAISDIERGKTGLQIAELHEVAKILGKELEYFLSSQPSAAVNYLRHNSSLSPDERRATLDSVDAFRKHVRERIKTEKKD